MRAVASIFPLVLRILLGGLFVFAASQKFLDPQAFADSVKAFKTLPDHLALLATFAIPWTELLCAGLILAGLWTRAAGLLLAASIAVFIAGILYALERGLSLECGCFGKFHWPCGIKITMCQVWRNAALAGAALLIVLAGPGIFSLDRLFTARRAARRA